MSRLTTLGAFTALLAALAAPASASAARCALSEADFSSEVKFRSGNRIGLTLLERIGSEGTATFTLGGCEVPSDTSGLSTVKVTIPTKQGSAVLTLSGSVTRVSGDENVILHYAFHQMEINHVGEDGTTAAHFSWTSR